MNTHEGGFTLIEVIVALVITGLIALSAYAAMDAGLATREHLDGSLRDREQGIIARGVLENALRHRVDHGPEGESIVRDAVGGGDAIAFETRGVMPPYGGSGLWRMEVHGATLSAHPVDAPGPELRTVMAGVQSIRVSALNDEGWHVGAQSVNSRTLAVRMEFMAPSGEQSIPSLIVQLHPRFDR